MSGPDGWMRLLRIRQGLQHGSLLNYVMRDDEGHALVIEWSRLYDFVILMFSLPFMLFVKQSVAIKIAGLALSPILSGLLAVVVAFIGKNFCKHSILWMSGVIVGTTVAFIKQNGFGTVQYHLFIVFMLATVVACGFELLIGRTCSQKRKLAIAAIGGVLGSLSILAMVENWPFVFAVYACIVCSDVFRKSKNLSLAWSLSFFLSMCLCLLIDPPFGGILVESYDHLSFVFVFLSLFLVIANLSLRLLQDKDGFLGLFIAIFIPMVVWLFLFIDVMLGPWGLAKDGDSKIFFAHTMQTMPIHGLFNMLSYGLPGILAFLVSARLAYINRYNIAVLCVLSIVSFSALFATGLAMRFAILTPFAGLFGTVAALYLIDLTIDAKGVIRGFLIRLSTLLLAVCGSIILLLISVKTESAKTDAIASDCSVTPSVAQDFDKYFGDNVVLTPINSVPELLYKTNIKTVGSLYQHGIPYFMKSYRDWYFANTKLNDIKYVAFCNDGTFVAAQSGSLGKSLFDGDVPKYLDSLKVVGGWHLFKVAD